MVEQGESRPGVSYNGSNEVRLEQLRRPILIGVSGGSASGKTTFAKSLAARFDVSVVDILFQDNYYKDQSQALLEGRDVNFDHPDAIDFQLMGNHLSQLANKGSVEVPIYDFATHSRLSETLRFDPRPVIIVDGILILTEPLIRSAFDYSIFMETPDEVRFERRLKRDVRERGREAEGVRAQYEKFVQPMYDQFIRPSQHWADLIVSGDGDFTHAVEGMEEHLKTLFQRFFIS